MEEDEKSADPYTYDERLSEVTLKLFNQRSEDLAKTFSDNFIEHVLKSRNLPGVSFMCQNLTYRLSIFARLDHTASSSLDFQTLTLRNR